MGLKKGNLLIILIIFPIFFLTVGTVSAKTYDFYVDASASGDEADGTKDKPFDTIDSAVKAALENSPDNRSIYLLAGIYKENLTLGKSVKLVGESQKKVTIVGKVYMEDKTSIANITISGKGSGIRVEKDATVTVENCRIRDFGSFGVFVGTGKGRITVRDSEVRKGNGKGFYIEAGREIDIEGNVIAENREEGIDIRAQVSGSIRENTILDNGESGIELLVGGSNLEIRKNTIKRNGSSGIASQFYQENNKRGVIRIYNNVIEKNKKFGIDCNAPSGGAYAANYFTRSIDIKENVILENGVKSITNACNIILAVKDVEEAKDNVLQEETPPSKPTLPEITVIPVEPEENIFGESEAIVELFEVAEKNYAASLSMIEQKNPILFLFVGLTIEERERLLREGQILRATLFQLEELEKTVLRQDNKTFLAETKNRLLEREQILNGRFKILEQRFSFGGWFRTFFKR